MCRIISIIAVIIALCFSVAAPTLVVKNTRKCSYIIPTVSDIRKVVTATGVLESVDSREIFIPSAIIPKDVSVSVGDYVSAGDVIAEIDIEATQNMLQNSLIATAKSFVPDEASEKLITDVLSKFGVESLPMSEVQSVFSQITSVEKTSKTIIPNKISAPIEGIITDISLKRGNLCQPSGAVAKVEDLSAMKAIVNVAENDIDNVKLGQTVELSGVGFGDKLVDGYVSKIYPCVARNSNGINFITAEITIYQPDFVLKPGSSVTASIIVSQNDKSCALPYDVIDQDIQNREFVYIFEEGRAVKRFISTGVEMPNKIEVTEGIGTDDIVLFPSDKLMEGGLVLLEGEENVY